MDSGLAQGEVDVGIDVGAHRLAWGWPALGASGSLDYGRRPKLPRHKELQAMQMWLRSSLPTGVRLWIDQPFDGHGPITVVQQLAATIGAVMTAQAWTYEPVEVNQSTWKAQVIGNHRAAKDTIQEWLQEHHPQLALRCQTEDEYDAMVIGLYGQGRAAGTYEPPNVRRPKRRRKKP